MPARAGSKGVPNKNFRPFAGGDCLTTRALEIGNWIADANVILSTDDDYYETPWWVDRVPRPPHLALDDTPMIDVLQHLYREFGWRYEDRIILLQPNCVALDRLEQVQKALCLQNYPIVSAWEYPDKWHPDYNIARGRQPMTRQSLTKAYRPNGLFYIWYGRHIANNMLWPAGSIVECDCVNIDTQADWDEAERLYANVRPSV